MANKQDLKDAMPPTELSEALGLPAIRSHDWHIQSSCALSGQGLTEGLEWISQHVRGGPASPATPSQKITSPEAIISGGAGSSVGSTPGARVSSPG